MRGGRRAVLATAAVMAAAALGAPAAHASDDGLRGVIDRAGPKITNDESRILKREAQYLKDHKPGPVQRAIRREIRDIGTTRGQLRATSASTSKGARAKRLLLAGLGRIATAYRRLDTALGSGDPASAGAQAKKAVKGAQRGRAEVQRAIKLLS
jgi:hypothetical protein